MLLFKITVTLIWLQISHQFEVSFLKNVKNKQLIAGKRISQKKNVTEMQCLFECSQHDECASVNYHTDDMVCMINKEVGDGDKLVDAKGWKYMEKSSMKVSTL